MKQLFIFILFIISTSLLLATSITVSGPLTEDAVWDVDTVFVAGTVIVPNDTTLTINPGVKVEFQGYYSIDVYGTLLAEGTESEMIHFTIDDTTGFLDYESEAGGWHGIRFEYSLEEEPNDSSKVVYCHIEYGKAIESVEEPPVRAVSNGGGIYVNSDNEVLIANNIIENCLAYWGAAIYVVNGSNHIIKNNIIRNNTAEFASGICCRFYASPLIIGNVIYGNSVQNSGGGIYMSNGSNPLIVNNTICDNTSNNIGAGLFMQEYSSPSLFNNIIWGNVSNGVGEQGFIWEDNCNPVFYNCAIEDSILGITLNPDSTFLNPLAHDIVIGFDPEFDTSVRYGSYELSATSPCINTGFNMPLLTLGEDDGLDLAGNSRIYGGYFKRVDMGAIEYQDNPVEQYIFNGDLMDYGFLDYTLCADSVFIYDDILIPDTVTVTICPGTYMEFQPTQYYTRDDERWDMSYRQGGYGIYVGGSLIANAEGQDQITMTAIDSMHTWSGILFDGYFSENGEGLSSVLNNCEIRYADSDENMGLRYIDYPGGAVSNYGYPNLSVENCTIHHNMGFVGGGITSFENAETYINNNAIFENYAFVGGGISIVDTTLLDDEIIIPPLRENGITTIENNEVYNNYAMLSGGGIHLIDLEVFFEDGPGFRDMLPEEYPYQVLNNNIHDNVAISHYIIMYYLMGGFRGDIESIDFEPYFDQVNVPYSYKVKRWISNIYDNVQNFTNSRYFTNLLSFGGGGIFASYVEVNIDGNTINNNYTFGYLSYDFQPIWYSGEPIYPYRIALGCGAGIHLRGYREDDWLVEPGLRSAPPYHPIVNNNDVGFNKIEIIPDIMIEREEASDRILETTSYATGMGAGIFSIDVSPIISNNNITDNTTTLMDTSSVYWDEYFYTRAGENEDIKEGNRDSSSFPAMGFGGGICQIAATMDTTLYDIEPIEDEIIASFHLNGNSILGNSAIFGGGVATLGWNISHFDNNIIDYNTTLPAFFDTEAIYRDTINFFYGVGGGIFNEGMLAITDGSISNNTAQMGGGIANALYNGPDLYYEPSRDLQEATLYIDNVNILNNNATGVLNFEAYYVDDDTTFTWGSGGGILLKDFDNEMPWYILDEYLDFWAYNNGLYRNGYPGSTTIINSNISNNHAAQIGGGIHVASKNIGHDLYVEGCSINNNSVDFDGGGISYQQYDNYYPSDPSYGNLTVVNTDFISNIAGGTGAGLLIEGSWETTIESCLIQNNSANIYAGGLWAVEGDSIGVVNSKFLDNYADSDAGGMFIVEYYNVDIYNNLIAGNEAGHDGGGVFVLETNHTDITNCTIANNRAHNEGGGLWSYGQDPVIQNTVIWGNFADSTGSQIQLEDWDYSLGVELHNCVIQGGSDEFGWDSGIYRDFAILDEDPLFADSANGDYTLTALSSCLNTGTPDTTGLGLPVLDLAGNSRIYDGVIDRIDIGAYEYQGDPTTHYYMDEPVILDDVTLHYDSIFVLCDVWIPDTVTVTFYPGTTIMFMSPDSAEADNFPHIDDTYSWYEEYDLQNYGLFVDGSIIAEGTETDSIVFTAQDTLWGWNGIVFDQTDSTNVSSFAYCKFERGRKLDANYMDYYWDHYWRETGRDIPAEDDPEYNIISQRIHEEDEMYYFGGAIYAYDFINFSVDNCYFVDNISTWGGAIYIKDFEEGYEEWGRDKDNRSKSKVHDREWGEEGPYITNSDFEYNESLVGGAVSIACGFNNPYFENCNFYYNGGIYKAYDEYNGGWYGEAGALHIGGENDPVFINCEFKHNYSVDDAGAIKIGGYGYAYFEDCIIDSNYAEVDGGGVKVGYYAYPWFDDCSINYNYAESKGGGIRTSAMAYLGLYGCDVIGNVSESMGGGLELHYDTYCYIDSCRILDNQAYEGGGVMVSGGSSGSPYAQIINTEISGNYADYGEVLRYGGDGGGLMIKEYAWVELINCQIYENEAEYNGGGFKVAGSSHVKVTNTVLGNNIAGYDGGGAKVGGYSYADFVNVTVSSNYAGNYGGGLYVGNSYDVEIINSIVWGNDAYYEEGDNLYFYDIYLYNRDGTMPEKTTASNNDREISELVNCIVENFDYYYFREDEDRYWGTFNYFDFDPDFVDPENNDFSLSGDSPAINNGTPDITDLELSDTDVIGNDRIYQGTYDARIDIGAYEYPGDPNTMWVFEDPVGTDYWCADTVRVFTDITVPDGDTLVICAGTTIYFHPEEAIWMYYEPLSTEEERYEEYYYNIDVYGCLLAVGAPQDSIVFTTPYNNDWSGIRFFSPEENNYRSKITYSRIENVDSEAGMLYRDYDSYGAITVYDYSNLRISRCVFQDNYGEFGGAISLQGISSPYIKENLFRDNYAYYGGAIGLSINSLPIYPLIENSRIEPDTNFVISDNIFYENDAISGGAIYAETQIAFRDDKNSRDYDECVQILNNEFYNNVAWGDTWFIPFGPVMEQVSEIRPDFGKENYERIKGFEKFNAKYYPDREFYLDQIILGGGAIHANNIDAIIEGNIIDENASFLIPMGGRQLFLIVGNGGGVLLSVEEDYIYQPVPDYIPEVSMCNNDVTRNLIFELFDPYNPYYYMMGGLGAGVCNLGYSGLIENNNFVGNRLDLEFMNRNPISTNKTQFTVYEDRQMDIGSGGGLLSVSFSNQYEDFNEMLVRKNLFTENSSLCGGGAFIEGSTYFVNNLVYDNEAGLEFINEYFPNEERILTGCGGGLAAVYGTRIYNNTIADNFALEAAGLYIEQGADVQNNIIWGNQYHEIIFREYGENVGINFDALNDTINISYNDIEGGLEEISFLQNPRDLIYESNLDEDPLFSYEGDHPYKLTSTSLAINSGNPDTTGMMLPELDLRDHDRIYDNYIVDMGAYEYGNNTPEDIYLDNYDVEENGLSEIFVSLLHTLDPDEEDSHSYTLVPGNGDDYNEDFEIREDSLFCTFSFNYESPTRDGISKVNGRINQQLSASADNYTRPSSVSIRVRTTDSGLGNLYYEKPLTINIIDMNDDPVLALPDSLYMWEDLPNQFYLGIYMSDEDMDDLTIIASPTEHLDPIAGDSTITVYPDLDWFGAEEMTFTVNDNQGRAICTDEAWIVVRPQNDDPMLDITDEFTAEEDIPSQVYDFTGYTSQTWGETDPLTLSAVNSPHINVTIDGMNVTFQSNTQDWYGTEVIHFNLTDGIPARGITKERIAGRGMVRDSAYVTVTPVNDPPLFAVDGYFFAYEDMPSQVYDFIPFVGQVWGEDDSLSLSTAGSTHIEAIIDSFNVVFQSTELNWYGTEPMLITVSDNVGRAVASDTVYVEILSVNDPPVLTFIENVNMDEDSSTNFGVSATDVDNPQEDLIFSHDVYVGPLDVVVNNVVGVGDNVDVTPELDWFGEGLIIIYVTDGNATDWQAVNVIVNDVNDPPVMDLPETLEFMEDDSLVVDFSEFIYDIDLYNDLTLTATDNSEISVLFNGLVATFKATENWSGMEPITFTVSDGITRNSNSSELTLGSQSGIRAIDTDMIEVTVLPVNDPPFTYPEEVAAADTIIFDEDTVYELDLTAIFDDYDLAWGDLLTFSATGNSDMEFDDNGGLASLTPTQDWNGLNMVTFTATDEAGEEASFNALVIVEPVNDLPIIDLPDEFIFAEGSSLYRHFGQYCYDVDGDPLTLTVDREDEIIVDIVGLNVTFSTADPLYYGQVDLIFTVDDGFSSTRVTASDTTTVVVYYVNQAPEYIGPEFINLLEDFEFYNIGNLNDLWTDVDSTENTQLEYQIVSFNPDRIFADIIENDLILESKLNYFGQANLVIAAIDDGIEGNRETVTIQREIEIEIAPVNDAPYFENVPDIIEMGANSMYQLILDNNWGDVDDLYPIMTAASPAGFVDVTRIPSYGYRFMINSQGVNGVTDYITLYLNDGHRDIVSDSIMVVVTNSEPPLITCEIPDQMLMEDFPSTMIIDLDNCFTDPEGDPVEYSVEVIGEARTPVFIAEIDEENVLYLASNVQDWFGTGSIIVTCTEIETSLDVSQEVLIHVQPVNDPPYVANPISDMAIYEDFESFMVADLNDVFDDVDTDELYFATPTYNSNLLDVELIGSELWFNAVPDANGFCQVTVYANDDGGRTMVLNRFNVEVIQLYDSPTFLPQLSGRTFPVPMGGQEVDFSPWINTYGQTNTIPMAFSLQGNEQYYDVSNSEDNIYGLYVVPIGYQWGYPEQACVLYLEGGATDTIYFSTNGSPYASQEIPDQIIRWDQSIDINLDDYFADPENDILTYSALADSEFVDVDIEGSIMTLTLVNIVDEAGSDVTVIADDCCGDRGTVDQTFTVFFDSNILLIDCLTNEFNNEISTTLDNLGYQYDYYYGYVPDYSSLQDYDVIVVTTGDNYFETIGSMGEIYLEEYLLNGGKLLLSSQDYLWDFYYSPSYDYIFDPADFPYDMLGLYAVTQDEWSEYSDITLPIIGVPGMFTEGMDFSVNSSGFHENTYLYVDELFWASASPILEVNDEYSGICATSFLSTVFTTVPIECIVEDQSRENFVAEALNYLYTAPTINVVAGLELETEETQITVNVTEIMPKDAELEYAVRGDQVDLTRNNGEFLIKSEDQISKEISIMAFDREANVVYKSSVKVRFSGEDTPEYISGLVNNVPNPFNPTTEIFYSVAEAEHVTIEIFNAKGQKVVTLVDKMVEAGNHSAVWKGYDISGKAVSSGVYFYRMECKSYKGTKKMILLR